MVNAANILLPTAYFPPMSYFVYLIQNEKALIEQMETYPKQTYRNRCEIMTSAGKLALVVPVIKPNGNHTLTKDIEICYREPWQQHHWKSIQTAYRSSPYFNYYSDILQPLFEESETSLIIHNQKVLSSICSIIGIDLSLTFTEDYIKIPVDFIDLRKEMTPKKQRTGISFPEYPQVFGHKFGYIEDLSVLDLLLNLGPDVNRYLQSIKTMS
jgi:hypothetical protein